MNNNILSIKRTSAIFLATVLVAGIIALSSPSFMTGAQAVPQYGMEREYGSYEQQTEYPSYKPDYKPSYGKDNYKSKDNVIVKKINCNNVNVNVNGLELNGLPPFLVNLLASDGQDGYGDASSYGSSSYGYGGQSSYDNNSFKFVCINNNNNTVIEEEQPIEPQTCEECLSANTTLQAIVENFLVEATDEVIFLINFPSFQESLTIPGNVDTIEQLCPLLEGHSDVFVDFLFSAILEVDFRTPESGIDALIECLLEAGIIVDRELPPIEICDNGIDDDGDGLVDSEDPECLL